MQRVAVVSGFAYHDNVHTQLTIHPEYGTWTSYRAVVVFYHYNNPANCKQQTTASCPPVTNHPTAPPPRVARTLLTRSEEATASTAMKRALALLSSTTTVNLCQHPHQPKSNGAPNDNDEDRQRMEAFRALIAVRDAIETGKVKYRFSENQLLYHYTKDFKYLRAAIMDAATDG